MKKFLASILTLTLCLGLATGCAGKQTPAENNTESAGETGVKEIPSLKIAFSPYADADQITTATEPLEQLPVCVPDLTAPVLHFWPFLLHRFQ